MKYGIEIPVCIFVITNVCAILRVTYYERMCLAELKYVDCFINRDVLIYIYTVHSLRVDIFQRQCYTVRISVLRYMYMCIPFL